MCNDSVQSDEGRARANLKGIPVNMAVILKHRTLVLNKPPIWYAKNVTYCPQTIAAFVLDYMCTICTQLSMYI